VNDYNVQQQIVLMLVSASLGLNKFPLPGKLINNEFTFRWWSQPL